MKKKALHKDIRQEIKKTFPRFLSLFLMSALGVSFFSGVRASMPDMLSTTDKYMKEANMFDLQVMSTMGLQEEDLEAVLETEGVREAELSYAADLLCDKEGEQYVVHLMSESSMAKPEAEEGRLPEKADEIFLDSELAKTLECKIGDKVTFYEEAEEKETESVLKKDTYTVVGIGSSPLYLSMGRGNASIGNGQVTGFAVVAPEAFNMEVYTQMNIKLDDGRELECYSKEYKNLVKNVQVALEETAEGQCEWRYDQIFDEAEEELKKAENELAEGKETAERELADGRKELDDGWMQILDGEKQLEDGKKKIADSEAQISQNEQSLKEARNQLAAARQKAETGAIQVSEGKAQTAEEEKKLDEAWQQLEQGKEELAAAKASAEQQLEAGRQQLEAQKGQLEESKSYLEALKAQIMQSESNLANKQAELSELENCLLQAQQRLEQTQAQIAELEGELGEPGDPQYDEVYAEIQELKKIEEQEAAAVRNNSASIEEKQGEIQGLEAGIAEMEGTMDGLQGKLSEAEAGLEAGYAALAEQESRMQQEFQAKEQEMACSEAQITEGRGKLQSAKDALSAAEAELKSGNLQIASYESQIASGQSQLAEGKQQIAQAKEELSAQEKKLSDSRKELEDGEKEYDQGKKDSEKEIADGEKQIADAKEELKKLEQPKWYVNSREEAVEDYGEMEDNAKQIGAIGKVFPSIFFLVAALVSLTTMTRMVEEQRGHIGTMKALGYRKTDIAMKYLWYAGSATLGGGAAGILIGQKLFPYVIQVSYGIMYDCLKKPEIPYRFGSAFQALGISFVCIMTATALSCMRELRELPAELMRPEAPKAGKRVILEHIPFIWKHLNFTTKSTFRNLFRYKKRLFMTIFGISATMALLVTGFGLRDSIIDLAEIQYDNIQLYDAIVTLNGTEQEKDELGQWLNDNDEVQASTMLHMEMPDVKTDEGSGEIYLCVPENIRDFETMTILKNRTSGKVYNLDEEGVLLTEWISDTLGADEGDIITLQKEDGDPVEVRVSGVVENYIMNYAYMSPALYESIYGEPAEYEVMYVELTEQGREHEKEIGAEILQRPGVYNVSYTTDTKNEINDMLQALVLVIIVLIVTAALLAYVVLYNLNNVNITERRRELATLKVLGFYDKEVAAYVYHENIILTFMGIVVGVFLGILLHQYIIHTIRVDMIMFGQSVSMISFLISGVLTTTFSAFVNFVMYFKLKEIDMVESLKSVE